MKREELPKFFCPVPFANLICHPDGLVSVCRLHPKEKSVGSLKESSLLEIWNGEKIKNWRNEFLQEDIKICKQQIANSSCYKRNEWLLDHIDIQVIQEKSPVSFTSNLYGKCNLQCPMCDVWKIQDNHYSQDFIKYLKNNIFKTIKHIDFYAGEPFIQKQTFDIINFIAKYNPLCRFEFTSNGQWKFTKRIEEVLQTIRINNIHISLDSFNELTYRQIRQGGDIFVPIALIKELINFFNDRYIKKIEQKYIEVSITVQQQNALELPNFIRKVDELGAEPLVQILLEPESLSVLSYPIPQREHLLDYYLTEMTKREMKLSHEVLRTLINTLDVKEKKKYILQLTRLLD